MTSSADDWIYVVTDIEVDGPAPGRNSMRSFASVAVTLDGTRHGEFEAVLEELPGAAPDPDTYAWFQTQPEAWAAATTDPEPPDAVMARFAAWVKDLPGRAAFAASPLAFDGLWIDHYLRRFTPYGAIPWPYEAEHLFEGPGLCIRSYASAVTGRPIAELTAPSLPSEWLGDVPHTHRAIDDALGYANLLVTLARRAADLRASGE
ncbi:MAG: hypothetical protein AB7I24_15550 [Candidatus Nanopelagicales bacterium]